MQEIRGPVDRIDDQALVGVLAFDHAAFFHQEAESGPRLVQLFVQDSFGAAIRFGDEVARSLSGYLKLFDLAEIPHQQARRLAGGVVHHIDKGGRHRHR